MTRSPSPAREDRKGHQAGPHRSTDGDHPPRPGCRSSRAIADAAWGEIGSQVACEASWSGTELVVAPRFFASTKTCSRRGWRTETMALSERRFSCSCCGLVIDRDTNAAANLAAWGEAEHDSASQAPDPQAGGRVTHAGGGRSAGRNLGDGGTAPASPPGGKEQEPTLVGPPA